MRYDSYTAQQIKIIVKLFVIFAIGYFSLNVAKADTIKIAVIDTGLDKDVLKQPVKLCPEGHSDFTTDANPFVDNFQHGTAISAIINAWAKKHDYCQIILKYKTKGLVLEKLAINNTIKAINKAIELKVDIINYSSSGSGFDVQEYLAIKRALNAGIKFVVSTGNEGEDLRFKPKYPTCYDSRIIAVVAIGKDKKPLSTSNYTGDSKIKWRSQCKNPNMEFERGSTSIAKKEFGHINNIGTSMAAAMRSGREIVKIVKSRKVAYVRPITK